MAVVQAAISRKLRVKYPTGALTTSGDPVYDTSSFDLKDGAGNEDVYAVSMALAGLSAYSTPSVEVVKTDGLANE